MPTIELKNVTKKFEDDFIAVDEVRLIIKDGEYATLLGPSGCGKTTLLRMIAGLIPPTSGDIKIDGRSVVSVPPEDRNIGYLFQNYALFPHMNIMENVGYGPIVRGESKFETKKITEDMLRMVNLLEWAHFLPNMLSGGMQQRVALVRSLAAGCRILFLDEPMSSLDPKIGIKLRYEIQKTARTLGLTVIHVTHDQEDAMSISDKVVVMKEGHVVQVGLPRQIYNNPVSPYVAYFIGDSNFIKVEPAGDDVVSFNGHKIVVQEFIKGAKDLVISIRPEKILFEKRLENTLEGVLVGKNFLGATTRFTFNIGSQKMIVCTAKRTELEVGDKAYLYMPPAGIKVFSNVKNLDEELRIL